MLCGILTDPEAAAVWWRWTGGQRYLQRYTQQSCAFLLIQFSLKTQESHLILSGLKTKGQQAEQLETKFWWRFFWKNLFRKGLPLQQNHFLPCYIHLQHSAGEKDECLSSAKKQTFDGYSENILQADFSWKLCVYSISDTEERYSWNLTRLVKQKSPGEASLIVTLKAKQTLDNTAWASDIELLASWCWFGFCMGSG